MSDETEYDEKAMLRMILRNQYLMMKAMMAIGNPMTPPRGLRERIIDMEQHLSWIARPSERISS